MKKRQKREYTINGVVYEGIDKVKAKARAILNARKDNDTLNAKETEFIKELLSHHEKKDSKLKDFASFTVGPHPEHKETRCFFIVKANGDKEDFSIAKCLSNYENAAK